MSKQSDRTESAAMVLTSCGEANAHIIQCPCCSQRLNIYVALCPAIVLPPVDEEAAEDDAATDVTQSAADEEAAEDDATDEEAAKDDAAEDDAGDAAARQQWRCGEWTAWEGDSLEHGAHWWQESQESHKYYKWDHTSHEWQGRTWKNAPEDGAHPEAIAEESLHPAPSTSADDAESLLPQAIASNSAATAAHPLLSTSRILFVESPLQSPVRITQRAPPFFKFFWDTVGSQSPLLQAAVSEFLRSGVAPTGGGDPDTDRMIEHALIQGWLARR